MDSLDHDILLLMTNLSQMEDRERALTLFTEALSSLHEGFLVEFSEEEPVAGNWVDISTMSRTYGYLTLSGEPEAVGASFPALFANSVQILATILENHHNRQLVLDDRLRLQEEVEAKTASLRQSDERYRSMIANIADVIAIISPEGIIDYKSPNIQRWFGWRPEELEGTDAWATVHPEDLERIQGAFLEILKTRDEPRTVTYRYKCKDGSYKWIELTAVNRTEDPSIGGVLMNYHDITERRKAEEELKNREEQFRLATEGSRDGLWDWDLRTGEAFHSDRFATMLGYEPDELPYTSEAWFDLLHPDDKETAIQAVEEYLSGEVDTYESIFRMRAKDGSFRWIIGRGKALFDEVGQPTRFVGFNTDITELKEKEEKLRAEERRWSLAQKVASFGNWEFDVASGTIRASKASFDLFGVHLDLEENPDQILPLDRVEASIPDRERVHQALVDLVERGEPYDLEYRVVREVDGEEIFIYARAEVLEDEKGQPEKVLGTIQDITERRRAEEERLRLEEQLHQSQKMEMVGRLAGGVAHDFNNMLGAIIGNAEMLRLALEREGVRPQELEEIEKAAYRSAELTRQLLGFARKQTVAPQVLDLNDTISGMYKMLLRLIGESIDLVWAPQRKLWPVRMDPSQVDQVLTNLMVNARDAIQGVGRVLLETKHVTVQEGDRSYPGEAEPGDYVLFSVTDDGAGMSEEVKARAFEPFFTTKPQGEGTGLGLATVYGIVRQNGGFIRVETEPGDGTSVQVYLPRYKGPLKLEDKPEERSPPRGGSETVMLVEDAGPVLRMVTKMLEGLGYTVVGALRPGEAIELAEAHLDEVDLLLTDVMMPEMNGRDLAFYLRSRIPGLRVLYMSGYSAEVMGRDGLVAEDANFIQKPFDRHTLAERVRQALDGEPGPL